jgi:hypothetical protein
MTGDSSSPTRFFVSNGIQGTPHLGFRSALGGLLLVGIRSDTGEELIDSAGADDGARDSSMDASGLPAQQRRISWYNRQNAAAGRSKAAVISFPAGA